MKLTRRYPSMRLDTAEDLYQEAFIAVQENLQRGNVRPNTDWNAYILTIGMNMASKNQRHVGIINTFGLQCDDKDGGGNRLVRRVEDMIKEMPEEDAALFDNPEVLARLGNELEHTPELCGKIIRLFYYAGYMMEDIAMATGLKNAQTAKVKKSQCMTDLIKRVTEALRSAGFDVTPKKRNRNGKN